MGAPGSDESFAPKNSVYITSIGFIHAWAGVGCVRDTYQKANPGLIRGWDNGGQDLESLPSVVSTDGISIVAILEGASYLNPRLTTSSRRIYAAGYQAT